MTLAEGTEILSVESENEPSSGKRTCLLVLGMHRSGTSALTRVLSLLGAALPNNLMPPATANNETGFWEPIQLANTHDRMLAEAGSSWDDWRKFDFGNLSEKRQVHYRSEIRGLIKAEFDDASLFVVKEPRVCRFVPIYRQILSEMNIAIRPIVAFRNPLSVAASLRARDGINESQSLLYWLRHVLDAEAATRDLPRAFVSYESLMSDWQGSLHSIRSALGIEWPRRIPDAAIDIDAFLSRSHEHHRVPRGALVASPDIDDLIKRAQAALERLTSGEKSKPIDEFNSISATFEAAASLFGNALAAERTSRVQCLTAQLAQHDATVAAAHSLTAAAKNETEQLREQVEHERLQHQQAIANALTEYRTLEEKTAKDQSQHQIAFNQARAAIEFLTDKLHEDELQNQAAIRKERADKEQAKNMIDKLAAQIAASSEREANLLAQLDAVLADKEAACSEAERFKSEREIYSATHVEAISAHRALTISLEQRLSLMQAELSRRSEVNEAILKSTSWRMTAPIRALKLFPSGVASGLRGTAAAIKLGGGVISTFAKTVRIYRTEGLGGIKWRIRYAQNARSQSIDALSTTEPQNTAREVPVAKFPDIQPAISSAAQRAHLHLKSSYREAGSARGLNLEFVPKLDTPVDVSACPISLIAFYLPQFHPIPENDAWWGRGFTEWTNVSKANPQYVGHYQPHYPGELGFYDLRLVDVQRQQIELAKHYGVTGFCYHHYWFGGKRLLERPTNQLLENPDLDFPFCLCWANENWTRRWDGMESDILIQQRHSPEDDIAFIKDIAPFLRDKRYIRFKGRPVLIVYRPSILPNARETGDRWRAYCRSFGIGEIYLVAARTFGSKDPRPFGFDAALEFPPHEANSRRINDDLEILNEDYQGNIYDFNDMASSYLEVDTEVPYPVIKTVCPSWDNEARKPGKGHVFHGANPLKYANWLRGACDTVERKSKENAEQPPFVFVNAWNEWAEGAHLEPDRRFGYGFLHATSSVIQSYCKPDAATSELLQQSQKNFKRTSKGLVIFHLFYPDLYDEMLPFLRNVASMDLAMSIGPNVSFGTVKRIRQDFPHAILFSFKNRGRDMLPFLNILRIAEGLGYEYGCKLHTKKSPQRKDGDRLRQHAISDLVGSPDATRSFQSRLENDAHLGLIAPRGSLLQLGEADRNVLNRSWLDRLLAKAGSPEQIGVYNWEFPAGSMYWFRLRALAPILDLALDAGDFEEEVGQFDGTLAHALERLIGLYVSQRNLRMVTTE